MTSNAKSHNILESLHQGSIANSKLVLTVHWSVMSNHDCQALGRLNFHELLLEPGKLMTWVVTLSPDVEVEHIASVCVECNHLGASWDALSILELDVHGVVTEFPILCGCLFV